jgi:hypothetical protein
MKEVFFFLWDGVMGLEPEGLEEREDEEKKERLLAFEEEVGEKMRDIKLGFFFWVEDPSVRVIFWWVFEWSCCEMILENEGM